jgi:type IV pilus assembly protein PilY1
MRHDRKKYIARTVLSSAVLVLISGHVRATDLADVPMAVKNQTKSNVIFTIDNSAGVDVDSIFPTYNGMYYESQATKQRMNGMWNLYPGINSRPPSLMLGNPGFNPDPLAWRAFYYGYNLTFYNPYNTYTPWPGTDQAGNPFGNASASAVKLEPYYTASATYNLTSVKDNYIAATYLNNALNGCFEPANCTIARGYLSDLYPAQYFMWNDSDGDGVMDANEGVRYLIAPSTPTYPSGRTYAAELQNFANWFQYYRTPFLAGKGAIGTSVAVMGASRVGLVDLKALKSPVKDMSVAANLKSFRDEVYALRLTGTMDDPDMYYQPLHERQNFVWEYFNKPAGSSNPSAPVEFACQQNFNVIVSPGYTNEEGPNWRNRYTNRVPGAITPKNYDSAWGVPYADRYQDTLADWTAYYYDKPLRTDLTTGKVPLAPGSHETNRNLHMSTYVLAPGASPVLSVENPDTPLANPQTANIYPPSGVAVSWPEPEFVGQTTIDDLWHSAVNGRGTFVNTSDIAAGISSIVDNIVGRTGSASAVAVANAHITSVDNASYATSYNSGTWTGNLNAYPIDLVTGIPDEQNPIWASSAQAQLDAVPAENRRIATYNGSGGQQFQPASAATATKLTSAQQTMLNTSGRTDGDKVVEYIRGDATYEGTVYRLRPHKLGDIVNAEPVFVGPPSASYLDPGYTTASTGFKAVKSSRPKMVYQGANDGMLHAFYASSGAEAWSYIPSFALPQLNNLTKMTGFGHKYYVDATPTSSDVDFGNVGGTVAAVDWRTILVGGMGKGGRGYYALNVTDPTAASESAVVSKVLWEFPNAATSSYAPSIGYTYGKPAIVKTDSAGWVVLVTSGYNNGSDTGGNGAGSLFVLNAKTGAVLRQISTGVGTSASPSGLSAISAYVENSDVDRTVDFVYGGDLYGNVWRFDLTGNIGSWSVKKLATLVDGSGNPQPIMTAPELARVKTTDGFKRMVYIGTGRYLGDTDVTDPIGRQTMYALVDNESGTPTISPLRSSLQQQTFVAVSATERTASTTTVDYASKKGWFIDLPGTGERVSTDPVLGQSVIAFVTNLPSDNPCTPGGSSWVNFLDFRDGNRVDDPAVVSSTYLGDVLGSRPVLIKLPSGQIKAIVRQSDANTTSFSAPSSTPVSGIRRISWREIPDS